MSEGEDAVCLSFHDVTYDLANGRRILDGVSGTVDGGSVMAIMGASGSGKTTLLQILAGQRLQTSGEVLLNGAKIQVSSKRYIGMVPQDDVLLSTSTVEEAVLFSAAMRLPAHYSLQERSTLVSKIICDLGLESVRSSRIGDSRMRRNAISGGEKKRTSIATELAHMPRILLLDEPTSGLDASSAHHLIHLLRTLAKTAGVAVAMTLHQPSSRDFELFDSLLVLSSGRTVYSGPRSCLLAHLQALGYTCPMYTNLAEFVIDVATGMDLEAHQATKAGAAWVRERAVGERVSELASAFALSPAGALQADKLHRIAQSRRERGVGESKRESSTQKQLSDREQLTAASHRSTSTEPNREAAGGGSKAVERERGRGRRATDGTEDGQDSEAFGGQAVSVGGGGGGVYATSFWVQFRLLFERSLKHASRNPVSSRAAVSRSVSMGLLVGLLFYGVDKTQVSVQDRTGALYFVLTTQIFSAQASMRVFLEERELFLREHSAAAYRTSAYYAAKSLADTPLMVANALLFSLIGYFLVGLQSSAAHVLTYSTTIAITTLTAESYVVFVAAAAPDDRVAAVLGPVAFALMSLLGGFFLNLESLPWWFGWLQHLSIFRYSFAAIMQNEFIGLNFTCTTEDTAKWVESLEESTREHVLEFVHLLPCPTPDGETHRKRLKVNTMPISGNIACLVGLIVLFRVLGYYALVQRANASVPTGAQKIVTAPKPMVNHQEAVHKDRQL